MIITADEMSEATPNRDEATYRRIVGWKGDNSSISIISGSGSISSISISIIIINIIAEDYP